MDAVTFGKVGQVEKKVDNVKNKVDGLYPKVATLKTNTLNVQVVQYITAGGLFGSYDTYPSGWSQNELRVYGHNWIGQQLWDLGSKDSCSWDAVGNDDTILIYCSDDNQKWAQFGFPEFGYGKQIGYVNTSSYYDRIVKLFYVPNDLTRQTGVVYGFNSYTYDGKGEWQKATWNGNSLGSFSDIDGTTLSWNSTSSPLCNWIFRGDDNNLYGHWGNNSYFGRLSGNTQAHAETFANSATNPSVTRNFSITFPTADPEFNNYLAVDSNGHIIVAYGPEPRVINSTTGSTIHNASNIVSPLGRPFKYGGDYFVVTYISNLSKIYIARVKNSDGSVVMKNYSFESFISDLSSYKMIARLHSDGIPYIFLVTSQGAQYTNQYKNSFKVSLQEMCEEMLLL